MAEPTKKSTRGFASMSLELRREISAAGGRAAHEKGTAHEFSTEEAKAAGKKGGSKIAEDREHMATIGRAGGKSRGVAMQEAAAEEEEANERRGRKR